jgi:hypothetical protein
MEVASTSGGSEFYSFDVTSTLPESCIEFHQFL